MYCIELPGTEKIAEASFRRFSLEKGMDSRKGKFQVTLFHDLDEKFSVVYLDAKERIKIGEGKSTDSECDNSIENALKNAEEFLKKKGNEKIFKIALEMLLDIRQESSIYIEDGGYGLFFCFSYAQTGMYILTEDLQDPQFYGRDLKGKNLKRFLKHDFPGMPEHYLEKFATMFKNLWNEEIVTWEDWKNQPLFD